MRRRRVVFPLALVPDNVPRLFEALRDAYAEVYPDDDVEWIRTADTCTDAKSRRRICAEARVVVSFARSDRDGVEMLEAMEAGCWPVAPLNVYAGRIPNRFLWSTDEGLTMLAHRVHVLLNIERPYK